MIATKITLTDSTMTFTDALEACVYFFTQDLDQDAHLLPHAVESLDSNWIENKQTFTFENSNSIGIVNYSVDQEKATLFAESLAFWGDIIPETSTFRVEQYPVDIIPAHAVPLLVDGNFYFDSGNIIEELTNVEII
jgi:hypothetical protein